MTTAQDEEALRLACSPAIDHTDPKTGGCLMYTREVRAIAAHLKRLLAEKAEANERRAETVVACDLLRLENERMRKGLEGIRDTLKPYPEGCVYMDDYGRDALTEAGIAGIEEFVAASLTPTPAVEAKPNEEEKP